MMKIIGNVGVSNFETSGFAKCKMGLLVIYITTLMLIHIIKFVSYSLKIYRTDIM
jgi:hypothetical protein